MVFSFSFGNVYASVTSTQVELIEKYSRIYSINSAYIYATIDCESGFQSVQSRMIDKYGIREDSWGVSQIHLPAHPDISKAEAMDEDFAIEYMAREFGNGNAKQWMCFSKIRGQFE